MLLRFKKHGSSTRSACGKFLKLAVIIIPSYLYEYFGSLKFPCTIRAFTFWVIEKQQVVRLFPNMSSRMGE